MKRLLGIWSGVAVCAAGLAGTVRSAEPKAGEPAAVKIVLYPAAAPVPALKYQLLPPMIERRPGNAAVNYGKVTAEQSSFFGNQQLQDKIGKWLEVPFHEFPKEEVRKEFQPPLHFLKLATRCESCDWDLPIREEPFFSILLPDVQQSRTFGRILALQARVHIAYGEYDKAIEMLQMGFALGRHVAEQPVLVSALVGGAIHRQMLDRTRELIQQPAAPNLYWALSMLPRPMIDLRKAVEAEMCAVYLSFPELRDLVVKDYPRDYWTYLLDKIVDQLSAAESQTLAPGAQRIFTTAKAVQGYPQARKWLLERGRTVEDVDKMPIAQVVLLNTMGTYDELRDDSSKWMFLPYHQAIAGLQTAEQKLREITADGHEALPLASLLLPAMTSVKKAEVRGEREFALLRALSALRLFASQHGRLPASLADITDVPVPEDPVHGAPFVYRAIGPTSAVLEAPSPPGGDHRRLGTVRYEIELKK